MTIRVTVRLAGGLVHTLGFSSREVELAAGATVAELLDAIGAEPAHALLVARDGWTIDGPDELRDGDRVLVTPVFSGG
jgi:sulfur carrier protein ThiS